MASVRNALTGYNRINRRPLAGGFPGATQGNRVNPNPVGSSLPSTVTNTGTRLVGGQAGPGLPQVKPAPTADQVRQWVAAGTAKPPGAPAGPTAAPYTGPGFDATYNSDITGINKTRDDTLAGITGQVNQANLNYGYTPTYDSAGNVVSEQVDPSNPFSQASLLQRTFQQNKARAGTSLAAQGQLYSGAYQNAQDQVRQGFDQGADSLRKNYESAVAQLLAGRGGANTTAAKGKADAYGAYVQRQLAAGVNPNDIPVVDENGNIIPKASAGQAGPSKDQVAAWLAASKKPAAKKVVGIDLGAIAGQKKGPKVIYK